jgi:hypothetical protein
LCDVGVVIYGQEDVCCVSEVGEDFFQGEGLGGLHEHVGHGGAEEDDGGFGEGIELFAFEVFLPEGDGLGSMLALVVVCRGVMVYAHCP